MTPFAIIVLIAILIIIVWLYLKRHPLNHLQPMSKPEDYIGQIFTLDFPVIRGIGVLQIDKTTWRIHCIDLQAGARIKIIGVEGLILLAEPNHG